MRNVQSDKYYIYKHIHIKTLTFQIDLGQKELLKRHTFCPYCFSYSYIILKPLNRVSFVSL